MQLVEEYLRIKILCSAPATPERVHRYKSGKLAGQTRVIKAKPARRGIIGVTEKCLYQWVKVGKFPKPIKLSENVTVWSARTVEAWMKAKEQEAAK